METLPVKTSESQIPLSYALPAKRSRGPRTLLVIGAAGFALFFGASLVLPRINPSRGQSNRVKCQSNMRQIGLAMFMYADQHAGKFPESLHEILADEDITPDVFVCPSGNDDRATGPTTRAVLDDFDQPGHCSYIYLGKGLTNACDPGTVLLYEPLSNHNGVGMNVLFGDGHAEFVAGAKAQSILNLIANQQPVIVK